MAVDKYLPFDTETLPWNDAKGCYEAKTQGHGYTVTNVSLDLSSVKDRYTTQNTTAVPNIVISDLISILFFTNTDDSFRNPDDGKTYFFKNKVEAVSHHFAVQTPTDALETTTLWSTRGIKYPNGQSVTIGMSITTNPADANGLLINGQAVSNGNKFTKVETITVQCQITHK